MKCSFCGKEILRGSGKIYAKKDGHVYFFCSKKCEKNQLQLKRNPQKTKWTNAFHKIKQFHAAKEKQVEKEVVKQKEKKKVSETKAERRKKKKVKKAKKREKRKRRKERKKKK